MGEEYFRRIVCSIGRQGDDDDGIASHTILGNRQALLGVDVSHLDVGGRRAVGWAIYWATGRSLGDEGQFFTFKKVPSRGAWQSRFNFRVWGAKVLARACVHVRAKLWSVRNWIPGPPPGCPGQVEQNGPGASGIWPLSSSHSSGSPASITEDDCLAESRVNTSQWEDALSTAPVAAHSR